MKIKFWILFLAVSSLSLAACSDNKKVSPKQASTTPAASHQLEDKYLKARDTYLNKFKNEKPWDKSDKDQAQAEGEVLHKEDQKALNELQNYLQEIIGPIKIDGFPENRKINIETLTEEFPGSNQLDGLTSYGSNGVLFVTTRYLLEKYSQREGWEEDINALSETNFYPLVFDWDSGYDTIAEIPVSNTNYKNIARAYLVASHQDVGPFVPNYIIVFFAKNDKVFLAKYNLKATDASQIPSCKKIYDQYLLSNQEKFAKAKAMKNKEEMQDYYKYASNAENETFKKYCQCWMEHAKEQKFFPNLQAQAQSLIDNLQHGQP